MSLVSSINSRGIFSFQKRVEKSEKSVEILTPTFHPSRLFRYRTTKYFSSSFYFPSLSSLPSFLFFFSFHFVSKRCPSNDQCIAVNAAASSVVNVSRRARFFKSMIPSPPPPRAYTMGGQDFFQCQGKTYPRHVSAKGSDIPPPPCFLARSPRCVLAILFHPPFLSSARSTCDLATGQVLSVGEFIRRMPVTPLSRIHFQINRPSSCGPSNRESSRVR